MQKVAFEFLLLLLPDEVHDLLWRHERLAKELAIRNTSQSNHSEPNLNIIVKEKIFSGRREK